MSANLLKVSCSHYLIFVYEAVVERNSRLSDRKLKERLDKKYATSLGVYLFEDALRGGCDDTTNVLARKYQLSQDYKKTAFNFLPRLRR